LGWEILWRDNFLGWEILCRLLHQIGGIVLSAMEEAFRKDVVLAARLIILSQLLCLSTHSILCHGPLQHVFTRYVNHVHKIAIPLFVVKKKEKRKAFEFSSN
jgi:hypothetical protein